MFNKNSTKSLFLLLIAGYKEEDKNDSANSVGEFSMISTNISLFNNPIESFLEKLYSLNSMYPLLIKYWHISLFPANATSMNDVVLSTVF